MIVDEFDTAMIAHAKARARVRVVTPGEHDRYGILVAWRPHRKDDAGERRRYTARVRYDRQSTDRTVDLTHATVEVLR